MGSTAGVEARSTGALMLPELFFKKFHYLVNKYRKSIDFLIQIYYNYKQV